MSSENAGRSTQMLVLCFVYSILLMAMRAIESHDAFWQLQSGK